jgi:hypothetical protein
MGLHVHAIAQPGCIPGDRIHRNVRIRSEQFLGCDCDANPPDVLLDLLHKYRPILRLSVGSSDGTCNGSFGTLSLQPNVDPDAVSDLSLQTRYSFLQDRLDMALVASPSINNLLLSTRNNTASIKFATTPQLFVRDLERMRITPEGHVGIGEKSPRELLHVGKRMTFHVGFEDDYIGYNVFRDVTYVNGQIDRQFDRLIPRSLEEQQFNAPPLKIGMSRHGYLELGAGAASGPNQEVDWYEGGSTFDRFAGLTLRNIDGKACASLGNYYPWPDTRLLVKAFERATATTNALVVLSSNNTDLLRVRNDGHVGIARANPMERLHIGDLITFHDGGGKFMGFNTYYNGQSRRLENIQGGRASVTIGVGDAVSNPGVFAIQIDQSQNIGPVMTSFKGLSMNTTGNVGIGAESPTARLHVQSGGTSATANALLVTNSAGSSLLTVREGGKVLIGPSTVATGTHADYRLSVDGKVVAKSFVATMTGWADYVFEPSYQLMPLDSLEAYISEHRHLPGVPTTQEVTSQGVDVTETMVTLLRKVEELTLYVIELKRENAALRREQTR